MEKLNRNSQNKQRLLDKMSKYITRYAKFKKVAKYLTLRKFKDLNGLTYNGMALEKNKLFKHTSFFKKYKREYKMMTKSGTILPDFYEHQKIWLDKNHFDYMLAEKIMHKLFNDEDNFTKENLEVFNGLYRELVREDRKNSGKVL